MMVSLIILLQIELYDRLSKIHMTKCISNSRSYTSAKLKLFWKFKSVTKNLSPRVYSVCKLIIISKTGCLITQILDLHKSFNGKFLFSLIFVRRFISIFTFHPTRTIPMIFLNTNAWENQKDINIKLHL